MYLRFKCFVITIIIILTTASCSQKDSSVKIMLNPQSITKNDISGIIIAEYKSKYSHRIFYINKDKLILLEGKDGNLEQTSFDLPGETLEYKHQTVTELVGNETPYYDVIMISSRKSQNNYLSCFAYTSKNSNQKAIYTQLFTTTTNMPLKTIACIRDRISREYYFITHDSNKIFAFDSKGVIKDSIPYNNDSTFTLWYIQNSLSVVCWNQVILESISVTSNKISKSLLCDLNDETYLKSNTEAIDSDRLSTFLPLLSKDKLYIFDIESSKIVDVFDKIEQFEDLDNYYYLINNSLHEYKYKGNLQPIFNNCKSVFKCENSSYFDSYLCLSTDNKLIYILLFGIDIQDPIRKCEIVFDESDPIISTCVDIYNQEIILRCKKSVYQYKFTPLLETK